MDIYNTVNQMRINHQTIFDLNIRVTYYVRVSTLKEEQDSSVDNQITHFEKLIEEHPNWTYVQGYVDRVRGESAVNRENFMRMVDDGKTGKFDLILTKEVSRFARNTIDSLTYTRELLRCGVGVFFQNDNICTVDGDAEFRLTIMSSIAQDEVRKLSERVKFGHKQSIKNGVVMGNSRIYGYDKNKGKLIINEKEAEMVRLIFDMYSTGKYALRAIERKLYELGYRSRNGNKIHHNTISAIITNPKYKGYYCGNKVKIADYRTKEQIFLPEEDWIMYKDETGEIVPKIVDEEIWDIANNIFKERSEDVKKYNHGKKSTSVLSGKIFCSHHNTPFWRTSYSHALHKEQSIYQWICREKKRGKTSDCPTFSIYETELYEILSKFFISMIDDINDYIDTFLEVYKKYDETQQIDIELKKLNTEMTNIEKKKECLLDLYTDGSLTKTDYKKQNNKINKIITDLENQIDNLTSKKNSCSDIEKDIKMIKNTLLEITNKNSKQISNEDIDILICNLVDRIDVTYVEKKTMSLNILVKNGNTKQVSFMRSSGGIFLKMCPKLRIKTTRVFGRNIVDFSFLVYLNFNV